jgi:hypothetical protein
MSALAALALLLSHLTPALDAFELQCQPAGAPEGLYG